MVIIMMMILLKLKIFISTISSLYIFHRVGDIPERIIQLLLKLFEHFGPPSRYYPKRAMLNCNNA